MQTELIVVCLYSLYHVLSKIYYQPKNPNYVDKNANERLLW